MARYVEHETKYDLPAAFTLPDLTGTASIAQVGPPVVHNLDATYLDTADLRLARHQVTVRRRTGGDDAGWHVKVPTTTAGERTEHRAPLNDRTLPADLDLQIRALRRDATLQPVAHLRTTRHERPLLDADGRVLALLAQDEVLAEVPDAQPCRWHELEVELVEGDPAVLAAVDRALRDAGAHPGSAPSKLARALGGRMPVPPPDPTGKTVAAVVAYARAQRDAILATDPAVRRDEPEAVHDMRVAIRRLRSTLRTYRPLWNSEQARGVRDELKWLAGQLGAVRDAEVMLTRLVDAVGAEPDDLVIGPVAGRIRQWLGTDTAAHREALLADLDQPRYLALLDAVDAILDSPPAKMRRRRLVARARTALRRADAELDAARTDPQLHASRRQFKRARYAVEALAPLAGKPATRLATKLTKLQDILGGHQDCVISQALLLDYATRAPAQGDSAFTYGLLHARHREAGRRLLDDLPAATRAARRRRLRRWLRRH